MRLFYMSIYLALLLADNSRGENGQHAFIGNDSGGSNNPDLGELNDPAEKTSNYIEHAYEAFERRDWSEAVAMYETAWDRLTKNDTFDSDTYILYALALEKMQTSQAIESAIDILQQGLAIYPDSELMHYNLGCYYMRREDLDSQDEALMEYNWIVERDPVSRSDAIYNRVLVLLHKGEWEAAAQSLVEAVIPIALNKFGKAWYEGTPWLIRQHQKAMRDVPAHASRVLNLKDLIDQTLPLLQRDEYDDEEEKMILEFGVADGSLPPLLQTIRQNLSQIRSSTGLTALLGSPQNGETMM